MAKLLCLVMQCVRQVPSLLSEQLRLRNLCTLEDTTKLLQKLSEGTLLIGGLDISYSTNDTSLAIAGIAVVRIGSEQNGFRPETLAINCLRISIEVPYVPNFLAFREVPTYQKVIQEFENHPSHQELVPDVFMVDSNGTLHARRFGAACHLGVLLGRPCFGVAKTLPLLDANANGLPSDLDAPKQRKIIEARVNNFEPTKPLYLYGKSETVDGAAILTGNSKKPLYVSPGHLITLKTAIEITRQCTIHRIPEPTRQADIRTREELSKII